MGKVAKKNGRPEKFTQEQIESHVIPTYLKLSSEGWPEGAICGELRVAKDFLYELEKKNQKFSDARKEGQQLRESFWYRLGMSAVSGKNKINETMFIWMSRNCVGWRNGESRSNEVKVETETSKSGNVTFKATWGSSSQDPEAES